jgi:hypothetical protein
VLIGRLLVHVSLLTQTYIQALASSDSFGSLYSEGVRRLRGLCRMTNLVPTSCRVSRDITEITTEPIMGHFSDVYSGMLDGRRVAIKVLRVHRDQLEQVQKVCSRIRSPTSCSYG